MTTMHVLSTAFNSHWEPFAWLALGVIGAFGLVTVLNPRRLAALALRAYGRVEAAKGASDSDEPAGSSVAVLILCRVVGAAVLAAVATTAYFLAQR